MEWLIKTTVSRQRPVRKIAAILAASFLAFVLAGCEEYKAFEGDTWSPLHADFVPVNSLRLAQVKALFTREEMQDPRGRDAENRTTYENLIEMGIPEEDIRDGSLGGGEVVCCGGSISEYVRIVFYVPPNLEIEVGDIVEVRAGELRGKPDESPNVATRLRQKRGTAAGCRWLPDNPTLKLRTLYCSGIEDEGWIQQGGIYKFWYRPPP